MYFFSSKQDRSGIETVKPLCAILANLSVHFLCYLCYVIYLLGWLFIYVFLYLFILFYVTIFIGKYILTYLLAVSTSVTDIHEREFIIGVTNSHQDN